MKITVTYNVVRKVAVGNPLDILADEDTVKTAEAIARGLQSLGNTVDLLAIDEQSVKRLKNHPTDFYFNSAFGIGGMAKSEADVAAFLERSGKPFSGSDAKAIILTTEKVATKKLLIAHDIPTPKYQVFSGCERLDPALSFPLVVKPATEDSSLGIGAASVVKTCPAAEKQMQIIRDEYDDPVLVEEYIEGRELNVTVLGNGEQARVLPISEIIFGPSFKNHYKVVDFAAKWEIDSWKYKETNGICPADLAEQVRKKVADTALSAYRLTGCRDYGRVDIRLDKSGVPYILEVNANPGIGLEDGASRSAKAAGLAYPQFLEEIVHIALARYENKS